MLMGGIECKVVQIECKVVLVKAVQSSTFLLPSIDTSIVAIYKLLTR